MHKRILLSALVLLPLAGGCSSQFAGEWVQESVRLRDGTLAAVEGERRTAFQFTPPSTVRLGTYSDVSGVVEEGTVSMSDYQTIQNRTVAEFGVYTARVEDGQLIAYIGGREQGRFRRLQGPSVFPPIVKLPSLVHGRPPSGPAETTGPAVAVAE